MDIIGSILLLSPKYLHWNSTAGTGCWKYKDEAAPSLKQLITVGDMTHRVGRTWVRGAVIEVRAKGYVALLFFFLFFGFCPWREVVEDSPGRT